MEKIIRIKELLKNGKELDYFLDDLESCLLTGLSFQKSIDIISVARKGNLDVCGILAFINTSKLGISAKDISNFTTAMDKVCDEKGKKNKIN